MSTQIHPAVFELHKNECTESRASHIYCPFCVKIGVRELDVIPLHIYGFQYHTIQ